MKINKLLTILISLTMIATIATANEKTKKEKSKTGKTIEIVTSEEIILDGILNNKSAELISKYKPAAVTGNSDSAFMLALLYKKSNEFEQCEVLRGKKDLIQKKLSGDECSKALDSLYLKWMKSAAKKNHPLALFEMALIYDKRKAIKYNKYKRLSRRSLYWIKRAAEKGERRAVGFLAEYERIMSE